MYLVRQDDRTLLVDSLNGLKISDEERRAIEAGDSVVLESGERIERWDLEVRAP